MTLAQHTLGFTPVHGVGALLSRFSRINMPSCIRIASFFSGAKVNKTNDSCQKQTAPVGHFFAHVDKTPALAAKAVTRS